MHTPTSLCLSSDRILTLRAQILEFHRRGTAHLDDLTRGQLRDLRDDCRYYNVPELVPAVDAALAALDARAADAARTAQSLARVAAYITDHNLLPLLAARPNAAAAPSSSSSASTAGAPPPYPTTAAAAAAAGTTTTTTTTTTTAAGHGGKLVWEAVGVEDGAARAVAGATVTAVDDACVGELYVSPLCTYASGDRTLVLELAYAKGAASLGVVATERVKALRRMGVAERRAARAERERLGMERDSWGLSERGEFWTEATPYSTGLAPLPAGARSRVAVRIDLDLGMVAFTRDNSTWSATIPRWTELSLAVVGARGCSYTLVTK